VTGLVALLGLACSQGEQGAQAPAAASGSGEPAASEATPPARAADDLAKGKQIYAINCTACHNADPSQDGVLGPAIAGASLELITARVVRGSYPPGYTPKRTTQQMVPLPHLASSMPALAAYLASVPAK